MNWLFLRVIVRPQGKVIDGVSLLALTVKGSSGRWLCGILFFREHCRKKRDKSLFHLISAAFLTGRGWCSGFFLFSFVFFFGVFFYFPLFLCYRYTWTAGISRSGLQTGTWCIITKSGQEHQQSIFQPFHHHENGRAEPLSGHVAKGYLTPQPTGSPDFY